MLDVEIADGAEYCGADEVNEQVGHGVVQPNIQIAADAQLLPVDRHGGNAVDGDGRIAVGGVQHDGSDGADDGVFLHIHRKQPVHAELKELPQYAHSHGKAECRQRHIDRRKRKLDAAVAIENVDHGEACGGAEKAGGGVQNGIPVGICDKIALQLAQNFGGKDKQQNDDLQCGGQLNAEVLLNKERQHEQDQYQKADERAFILTAQNRGDQYGGHDETQHQIYGKNSGLAANGPAEIAGVGERFAALCHDLIPF